MSLFDNWPHPFEIVAGKINIVSTIEWQLTLNAEQISKYTYLALWIGHEVKQRGHDNDFMLSFFSIFANNLRL